MGGEERDAVGAGHRPVAPFTRKVLVLDWSDNEGDTEVRLNYYSRWMAWYRWVIDVLG